MALAISGVTGTISDGQSITITGTDFGATGPTIVVFDNFEGGTNGNLIATGEGSATVGEWDALLNNTSAPPKYSTTQKHSGSMSMRHVWNDGTGGEDPGSRLRVDFAAQEVFWSYWFRCSTADGGVPGQQWGTPSPNWKQWTIYQGDTWDYNVSWANVLIAGTTDWPLEGTYGPMSPWDYSGDPRYTPPPGWSDLNAESGTWHRIDNYLKASPTNEGAYGSWDVSANQAYNTQCSGSGVRTTVSGTEWNHIYFPGFAREDAVTTYMDDIYIATGAACRARVEIGNNATYTSCTNLAVCTPTAWGDTEITATVRAGSFTTGTAYLFVVDASGNASAGKEITLGNTYGSAKVMGVSTGSISKIDGVAIASINKIFGYDF